VLGYSEANAVPPPPPLKAGILIVTLHEGLDFALPIEAEKARLQQQHAGSLSTGGGFSVAGSMRPSGRQPVGSYVSGVRPASAAGNGAINAAPTIHGRYSTKYLPYALIDFDKQQVFINAVSGTPQNPVWAGDNTQYKFDVSRVTDISMSLYIRNPNTPANTGRNDDIFLGTFKITPRFEEVSSYVEDPKLKQKPGTSPARPGGQVGTEWLEVQHGSGKMKVGVRFVENRQSSLKIEDFDLLKVVGKGSFGKVMQVQYVYVLNLSIVYSLSIGRRIPIVSMP
jgi:serum/glucocorticoid-regulated kinase 2